MIKQERKVYVLDTSALLHSNEVLFAFEENDVVIPFIVLQELDKKKNGNDEINFIAREAIRFLEQLPAGIYENGGLPIDKKNKLGKLRIYSGGFSENNSLVKDKLTESTADNEIIKTIQILSETDKKAVYILVSKDVSLRLIAKALGIKAEDYQKDKVKIGLIKNLELKKVVIKNFNYDLFSQGNPIETPNECRLIANQFVQIVFSIENTPKNPIYAINKVLSNGKQELRGVNEKISAFGITHLNLEQQFALYVLLDPEIRCVALSGPAGTGKTLMALAAGLEQLSFSGTSKSPKKKERKMFESILVTRSPVDIDNKEIGFLPGDADAKLNPYMEPFWDNLGFISKIGEGSYRSKIDKFKQEGKIKIQPISFARGRTFENTYFILDEAQNSTLREVKTLVTRMGLNSKIIIIGDLAQIDNPYLDDLSNGLAQVINKLAGASIFAHIPLIDGERSELSNLASQKL